MTLHINFWAGPCAGKSTLSAGLFALLKDQYFVDCELTGEQAKDYVWEGRTEIFKNQFYIAAKQYQREQRLDGKVDVVISDSPLPLSLFYTPEDYPASYSDTILNLFRRRNTLNILVRRVKPYNPKGRNQTKLEALAIDDSVAKFLIDNGIEYHIIDGSLAGLYDLIVLTLSTLRRDPLADDLGPIIKAFQKLQALSGSFEPE